MNRYKNGLGWGLAAGALSGLLTIAVAYGADSQPAPVPSAQPVAPTSSTTTPPPAKVVKETRKKVRDHKRRDHKVPANGNAPAQPQTETQKPVENGNVQK